MKNQKKLFSALLIGTFLVGAVNVKAMDVTSEATLKECLTKNVATAETCTVKNDITVAEATDADRIITVGAKILDLGSYNINGTAAAEKHHGVITVGENSSLTIQGTGRITSDANFGVVLQVRANSTLAITGGTITGDTYGISGNGNDSGTNITISGTNTIVTGTKGMGIYHPQVGTLTVNSGIIQGKTGIEMRAGNLVLNGGTVKGTGTPVTSGGNTSGATTTGAGIAVVQHTTKQPINVQVKGGNVEGYVALFEKNLQGNTAEDLAKISFNITGGNFMTTNTAATKKTVDVENVKNFITGGTFDVAPAADTLDDGVHLVNGVVKAYEIQLDFDSAEVDVTMTPAKPVPGDKVKVVVTSKVGEGIVYVNAYENGKIVTVTKNENGEFEFEMPSNDVYVNVRAEKYGVYNYLETEANEQVNVNENYENWHGFSGYFSENAAKTIEKIVTGMVEDVEHKMVDVSGYVEAYEYDFDKNYEDLTDEGKALYDGVKKLLPKGNTIVGFGNVTLYPVEYVDGENWKNIELGNKLSEKITYTLQLPDAYKGKSKYYGLARVVDGKLEVVRGALSQDGMSISFESDQIGDFIFVYGDIANPATYDAGISTYVIAGSISLIGLLALTLVAKKKIFNK